MDLSLSAEDQAKKAEKDRAMSDRSDAAWQKAQPAIQEWAAKGKLKSIPAPQAMPPVATF